MSLIYIENLIKHIEDDLIQITNPIYYLEQYKKEKKENKKSEKKMRRN